MTADPGRRGSWGTPARTAGAGQGPAGGAGQGSAAGLTSGSTGAGAAGQEALVLEQSFGRESLYALRAAVAAHGAGAGLLPERVDDLVVAAHELAANVIRHGRGHGRMRLWLTGTALRCEIADGEMAGADGGAPEGGGAPAQPWPIEHGHGLWLVSRVADKVSLCAAAGGSLAVATFTLGAPARSHPAPRSPN